jgi:hypothetical protein
VGRTCMCGYRTRGTDIPRCGSTRRTSSGGDHSIPAARTERSAGPS